MHIPSEKCKLNPQSTGGPIENQKGYFSGTQSRIDLKPDCKSKGFLALVVLAQLGTLEVGLVSV